MDTNLLNQMLLERMATPISSQTAIVVVTLVLTALAPVLAGVAAYFASKASANNRETKEAVKEIHIAVNSERAAMLEKVKQLTQVVLDVSKDNATLREQAKGVEVAAATAAAVAKEIAKAKP